MFGEATILGHNELTIDSKGRAFIPAETKREAGEELVLLYDEELEIYKVYSIHEIEKVLEKLNKKLLNSKSSLEALHLKKRIYEISKSVLRRSKIDSQGRMNFGTIFENYEKVLSIGCYNHLVIKPIEKK